MIACRSLRQRHQEEEEVPFRGLNSGAPVAVCGGLPEDTGRKSPAGVSSTFIKEPRSSLSFFPEVAEGAPDAPLGLQDPGGAHYRLLTGQAGMR